MSKDIWIIPSDGEIRPNRLRIEPGEIIPGGRGKPVKINIPDGKEDKNDNHTT
jgi:hypothetical protein